MPETSPRLWQNNLPTFHLFHYLFLILCMSLQLGLVAVPRSRLKTWGENLNFCCFLFLQQPRSVFKKSWNFFNICKLPFCVFFLFMVASMFFNTWLGHIGLWLEFAGVMVYGSENLKEFDRCFLSHPTFFSLTFSLRLIACLMHPPFSRWLRLWV